MLHIRQNHPKDRQENGETTLAFVKPKYYSNIKSAILGACEVRKVEEAFQDVV